MFTTGVFPRLPSAAGLARARGRLRDHRAGGTDADAAGVSEAPREAVLGAAGTATGMKGTGTGVE